MSQVWGSWTCVILLRFFGLIYIQAMPLSQSKAFNSFLVAFALP
jgi:hypothetical protein